MFLSEMATTFFFSCLLLWGGVGGWAFRLVHCLSFTSLSLLKLSFAVFLQIFFFLAFYLPQFLSREFAYISSIYLLFFLALNQSVLLYVVASDQPNKQTKKKKKIQRHTHLLFGTCICSAKKPEASFSAFIDKGVLVFFFFLSRELKWSTSPLPRY